jgi:hypothetical protein
MRSAVLGLACAFALVVVPASAQAAELHATPSNLSSTFAAARGGDTVRLASGSYGTFAGAAKSGGVVTVAPEAGASVTMSINFNGASFVRVEGVTIPYAVVQGASHDVTIAKSTFTGDALIRSERMANANVVFDGNTHNNITPSGGYEGRISLTAGGPSPSGVVIKNSRFSGGASDGIQDGSNGAQILNNEFSNLKQGDPNVAHTDAVQLYGARNAVVRGNYFHDVEDGIMAPDGTDHELIEHNVVVTSGSQFAITLGADSGSVIRHNTLVNTGLRILSKEGMPISSGTVIRDNVMANLLRESGSATQDHNLLASGTLSTADLRGRPVFAGGAKPTTYAGHLLAAGSPGKGNASDGTDRGISATPATVPGPGGSGDAGGGAATPPVTAPVTPAPAVDPAAAKPGGASGANGEGAAAAATGVFGMRVRKWSFSPVQPRVRARVVLSAPRPKGQHWQCRWRYSAVTRKGCVTVFRFGTPGLKKVTLTVTDSAGTAVKSTKRIRVLKRR